MHNMTLLTPAKVALGQVCELFSLKGQHLATVSQLASCPQDIQIYAFKTFILRLQMLRPWSILKLLTLWLPILTHQWLVPPNCDAPLI
jgi:uncharacterized membrane protein